MNAAGSARALACCLILGIAALMALHLRVGVFDTGLAEVWRYLWVDDGSNAAFSLREFRLPRALNALFVGAGLAMSGALIQVIIRNPLGDPGLTGVTSGAAFGVAVVITYWSYAGWAIVAGGVTGGVIAAAATFTLARGVQMRDLAVILSGIAVSIFFLALTSAVMVLNRSSMQTLYYWLIGGFSNKGWVEFAWLWPWVTLGGGLAVLCAPVLDILRMDDAVASGLGVNTGAWRLIGGAISVVLAATAVAVAGPIGFVGFVAPHLVRVALCKGNRSVSMVQLLPLAALTGGFLTLAADLAARVLPIYARAPAGVLITVLGGIAFLVLARRLPGRDL